MFAKLSHTHRKRVEKKLKTSFAKFLILCETSHGKLSIVDLLDSWKRGEHGSSMNKQLVNMRVAKV